MELEKKEIRTLMMCVEYALENYVENLGEGNKNELKPYMQSIFRKLDKMSGYTYLKEEAKEKEAE